MEIFSYNSHIPFLIDRLKSPPKGSRTSKAQSLSNQQIAKKLGYQSARSIGMILNGKRLPSPSMILQIASYLKLDDQEKRYLELLVCREQLIRKKKTFTLVEQDLKRLNPHLTEVTVLDLTYFSYVADWYNFVLKQLIAIPSFRNDLAWIQQRLKNKVSIEEIKKGLRNLKLLGLISDKNGKLSILSSRVTTSHDLPSEKIRSHHKQMMERAIEALEEEPIENREYFSLTFRVDRKKIPELKKEIRKFKTKMETQFESTASEDVFQMNLQFFPHTHNLLEKGRGQ